MDFRGLDMANDRTAGGEPIWLARVLDLALPDDLKLQRWYVWHEIDVEGKVVRGCALIAAPTVLIGVEAVPQGIPGGVEAEVSLIEVAYRRVRSVQTSQHVTAGDGRSEVTRGSVKIELEVALGNLGDSIELATETRRDYGNPDTARKHADALADAISARL